MDFLYLLFFYIRLRFLDVETNPSPRRPVSAICRILFSKGPAGNLSDLTVALSMIYCSALRHWSQICVTCRSCCSRIRSPCLVVPGQDASGQRDGWIGNRWLWSSLLPNLNVVVANGY